VPASYSFNLNGSSIYLTLALVFLAQAGQVELSLAQYGTVLLVAMVTSKASSGIAGSAFVTLGATLAAVPAISPEGLVLIVSIERLLKCRPIANLIGNGIACLAVATWMGEVDAAKLRDSLVGGRHHLNVVV
jgi:aerobic C4-dicarboxylate transport protein